MHIDLTQVDPEEFELLCEDLLHAMGFFIGAKVSRGPDLGRDIIAVQTTTDLVGFSETHRYLIECKHYAKSGRSVREKDIGSPIARMGTHDCDRYILITSTVPSEQARKQLAKVTSTVPYYQATTWSKGDLARLLDEYPNVRERYFPSPPAEPPTPVGALAETVEQLLTVMGFTCQERRSTADRVRLICTRKGTLTGSVVVVCKEGLVERGDVESLIAETKSHELGGAVLVTHTRISPAARELAAKTGDTVRAFTLDEFYRELIDFEPYVRAMVDSYEKSELSSCYVDLGCQSSDKSIYKPMDEYVDNWLDDPARNHISILGDYGTGKTSFCRQYAARLGRRWLADPDRNRIPILISLRDYAKSMNLGQLITDFLVNRYSIPAGYEAFRRFNAAGKLVLLFDGFDEMAQKVDDQTTVNNFEELARAVEANSKVVLTCRMSYFRTSEEAQRLLSQRGQQLLAYAQSPPEQVAIDLTHRPNFEIVRLLPFDQQDIQFVLRARYPNKWRQYWQEIKSTYNLAELAQRPVLLDMIAHSLPELKPMHAINAARLYESYTDMWLLRDEEKGRTLITREDKRLFMQELALEMLRRDELSIHYARLPERIRKYYKLERAHEVDYFDHDIRTCSFLKRDDEGDYHFVHRSFQEFFVAQWLAPRLLDGSAPETRINEEIRGFVHGLLTEADWPPSLPTGVKVPEGMVWVPPGPFIMGSENEEGIWVIMLEEGFFVTRTPVTNDEFARFVEATGYATTAEKEGGLDPETLRPVIGFDWRHPDGPSSSIEDRMDHPVVQVSWQDAIAYAEWAGGRLLAEQEWEKAARGIDGRIYPWGDDPDDALCNTRESGIRTTTPVGRYSPDGDSPCGCADMAGNVWEWTRSEWQSDSGRGVLQGSSSNNSMDSAPAACRIRISPDHRNRDVGFRVAVTAQTVFRSIRG
jgi:formylglycine-generating enzyme required for sulfatase activity